MLHQAQYLVYIKKEDTAGEEAFQKAIKAEPSNMDVLISYALFLKNIKRDQEKAEKYAYQAEKINPTNPRVISMIAAVKKGDMIVYIEYMYTNPICRHR